MSADLFPPDLEPKPLRVVWHWTAGRHTASAYERTRYHVLIEQRPGERPGDAGIRLVQGVPIARNMRSLSGVPAAHDDPARGYAAHTGGLNTRSIGIALCGMFDAVDLRPRGTVAPGPYPITIHQVRAMLALSVTAALTYGLEVNRQTFLTHAEVFGEFGRGRQDKWNISWLPGFDLAPEGVGPFLRKQLRRWLAREQIDERLYTPPVGDGPEDVLLEDVG